ncbi:MAG: biotin/lipoyl-binding protein [Alphaproteobacteria bacterium]|nr:biotin/lipoyl-binding protein [Alphaproteobacteria bacterium]
MEAHGSVARSREGLAMRYEVELEGRKVVVDVERAEGGWRVRMDEGEWAAWGGGFVQPGELRLVNGGRSTTVGTHVHGDRVALQVDGHPLDARVVDPRSASAAMGGGAAEGVLATPMPGVVVRIPVAVGDRVTAGQVVIVVEAMKMENEFKAPVDGVVESIEVQIGQALEANAVLARIGE